MASFFEKLKKGMGIDEEASEEERKAEEKPKPRRQRKKEAIAPPAPSPPVELKIAAEPPEPEKKVEVAEENNKKDEWNFGEAAGQLAVDVCQTETELIIQSAIAGIKPENIDISLERDVLAIKGVRRKTFEANGDYFAKECYWGPFSREIILPVEVDPDKAEASMKEGILTIRIPKILREKKRAISVKV